MTPGTSRLIRGGTALLTALAFVSGGPLGGSAGAAHSSPADALVVTPSTTSAAVDTCVTFTATLTAGGRAAESNPVDVLTAEQPPSGATDVDACGPAPLRATDSGAAGSGDRAEYRTGTDGTVTFGVTSSATGTVGITVFADLNNDDTRQAGEPQDVVTLFVTSRDVSCVDATPESATALAGEQTVISVKVTNNVRTDLRKGTSTHDGNVADSGTGTCSGDAVQGVTPRVTLTGANTGTVVTCGATDATGVARCSYTGTRTGSDTLVVFVDEGGSAGKDAGEAGDSVTRTFTAPPSGLQVDLTCADAPTSEDCVVTLPASRGGSTVQLVAQVTAPDGNDAGTDRDPAPGVTVVFTETAAGATVTAECVTDAAGRCTATLSEATPVAGEVVAVTATVRGQDARGDLAEDQASATGERSADTARVSFRNTPGTARYVDLRPEGPYTTTAGQAREVTAVVTDVDGSPVQGVQVTFTETGPGTFTTGTSVVATTDGSGTARATLTSAGTESGPQQVTATITTSGTQCAQAAGQGGSAQTPNPVAGTCADTEENRIAGPSPVPPTSASPRPSATPSTPPACSTPAVLSTGTSEITFGREGVVTARATPGRTVLLYAYSRPSTEFRLIRTAVAQPDGTVTWAVRPPTNSRLYAQESGCAAGPSIVITVRSLVSINALRLGTRLYEFSGSVQPRRAGQGVSLYRVTSTGAQVLTAQARTDANGVYRVTRQFTGAGQFGFVVRSSSDLVNDGGSSAVRPTVVH